MIASFEASASSLDYSLLLALFCNAFDSKVWQTVPSYGSLLDLSVLRKKAFAEHVELRWINCATLSVCFS